MPKLCKACRDRKKKRYEQEQKEKELEEILLTLPFKQIGKTDIAFIDPNKVLFIIGNGFDFMHGVPSSYYNFRDSMGRHNELRNALEMYIKKEDLWAEFEESLAHLDDEAMLGTVNDWMDIFDVKDQFDDDFSAADFFMAAETATGPAQTIIRELPKRFRKWICTLKPTIAGKPLEGIINNQSTFINFNYTEFLETIYEVPKKNVWYIHGDRRNKKKELILGHAPGAGLEEDNNPSGRRNNRSRMKSQTAYDLHETAGNYLGDYYASTTKKSGDVIKANKERFEALSDSLRENTGFQTRDERNHLVKLVSNMVDDIIDVYHVMSGFHMVAYGLGYWYNGHMRDEERFTYGRTSVYNLNYHIIWRTKYRNQVINPAISARLKDILYDIAAEYGFTISHLEVGLDDHIHLMVSAPPKLSVTNIVRWLKGTSARLLFLEFPELKKSYWKKEDRHLWAPSYFVESIGTTNEHAIAKYIDDQRRKEGQPDGIERHQN